MMTARCLDPSPCFGECRINVAVGHIEPRPQKYPHVFQKLRAVLRVVFITRLVCEISINLAHLIYSDAIGFQDKGANMPMKLDGFA